MLPYSHAILFCSLILVTLANSQIKVRQCSPIQVALCQNLGYNQTSSPNFAGHASQQEADEALQSYAPLIKFGCSKLLPLLLCTVFVPMCNEQVENPIGPCRPLCESVKSKCQPVMQNFGYDWPPDLACEAFPPRNDYKHMCMPGPPQVEEPEPSENIDWINGLGNGRTTTGRINTVRSTRLTLPSPHCRKLKNSERYIFINRTTSCALTCERSADFYGPVDNLFTKDEKKDADTVMAICAIICLIGSTFTILTYLIAMEHVRYPDKCIVFISVCYAFYAVGYLTRIFAGRGQVSCRAESLTGREIMITRGLDNTNCTIVFLITYYFNLAGHIWWLGLTIAWTLSVGFRWKPEKIARYSTSLHTAAWVIPAILMVTLLIMRSVGTDELLGMCSVSSDNSDTFLGFAIIPPLLCLGFGALLILIGICSLLRHNNGVPSSSTYRAHSPGRYPQNAHEYSTRSQASGSMMAPSDDPPRNLTAHQQKNENHIIWTGFFTVLYCVPAVCVLACWFYEYLNQEKWLLKQSAELPKREIFFLKVVMSLSTGVLCAFWCFARSAIQLWTNFILRTCFRRNKQPDLNYASYAHAYPSQSNYLLQEREKLRVQQHTNMHMSKMTGMPTAGSAYHHEYPHV